MQGVFGGFAVSLQKVEEESVFPGTASHRSRFDFGEIDFAQRENTERFEKHSRLIRKSDGNRNFVGIFRRARLAFDQEEPRVVLRVVFEVRLQNLSAIYI